MVTKEDVEKAKAAAKADDAEAAALAAADVDAIEAALAAADIDAIEAATVEQYIRYGMGIETPEETLERLEEERTHG